MNVILINQPIPDPDLQLKMSNSNADNYLIYELSYLTDSQAKILSKFKGHRIDLSKLLKISEKQLAELSKFCGEKIELGGIYNVNDRVVEILNSFPISITKILTFKVNDSEDVDRIINCIKNIKNINLGCLGYINIVTSEIYIDKIKTAVGCVDFNYCFNC